jgi:prevent-host-death family protein
MLNLSNDIKPISYVKAHTAEMLKQVEDGRNPIIITQNGKAKAVLIDVDSYQKLINSINLMKLISIGEKDFQKKQFITDNELEQEINRILD